MNLPEEPAWEQLKTASLLEALNSTRRGLSSSEATARLKRYGPNRIEERKRVSQPVLFLRQFQSPLIYLLLAAALITLALGKYVDTLVIGIVVGANAVLGFVQENRAENVLEALKQLTAPQVKALRDGELKALAIDVLVPGDIVALEAGDRIPADLRLIEAANVKADESALTGESVTVDKVARAGGQNIVYASTVMTSGRGVGVVIATGSQTEFGAIAQAIQETRRELTPLQKNLAKLGRWIFVLVVCASALIVALGLVRGETFYDIFLIAVSQAVSSIPEGLPAVITVVLTSGVRIMARNNAYVRRLAAVETLGATTVILSDKTGTLTRNVMTVVESHAGQALVACVNEDEDTDEGSRALNNEGEQLGAPTHLLYTISALCNDVRVTDDDMLGDPTEIALVTAAAKDGVNKKELEDAQPRIDEIPFDPLNQYMATLHALPDKSHLVYIKGAPEVVLKRSSTAYCEYFRVPLRQQQRSSITEHYEHMAAQGLRVLACAYKRWDPTRQYSEETLDEDFVFVGLVGMIDPPREEVRQALSESARAGIRTIMVTGDNPLTARAIAVSLGIAPPDAEVLTSDELQRLDDDALRQRLQNVSVFARAKPVDKQRLVTAFQSEGNIVAVTGDGVNDAPALFKADIGVAMGRSGTEVAKEAADMILADDNYATIVAAVREGRRIFDNLRKVLIYLIATNGAQVTIILSAIIIGLPLPLYPIQILWINLITDGICVIPLGLEAEEPDLMMRSPRDPKEGIFSRLLKQRIVFLSLVMAVGTLLVFYERLGVYSNIDETRTAAFITISLFQLVNAINSRSEKPVLNRRFLANRYLLGAITLALALQLATVYAPFMQDAFRTIPIAAVDYAYIFVVCVSLLFIEDGRKHLMSRLKRHS
ncbi:MAG: cation-translocating P-type ATPase [Halobacteriota archaeon]